MRGLYTALLLVLFLGIWAWAWSSRRRQTYDEAARRPLEPDEAPPRGPRAGS